MSEFNSTSISTSGAPGIVFKFAGGTCTAELAGARLYIERRRDEDFDMRLTAADGEVLADIVVCKRPHRNDAENVTDVGSALLWSHWRHVEAERAKGSKHYPPGMGEESRRLHREYNVLVAAQRAGAANGPEVIKLTDECNAKGIILVPGGENS